MKKVKSLQQVQDSVNDREEFFQDINGKIYKLDVVRVLGMTLLETITMIKEGRLLYQPEQ